MSEPLQKGILSFLQLDGTPQTLAGAARVYEKGSRLSRRRYSCARGRPWVRTTPGAGTLNWAVTSLGSVVVKRIGLPVGDRALRRPATPEQLVL